MLIDACKKDSTTTGTSTATTTSSSTTTTANGTSSSCITVPTEEEGPFPYAGGELTNPLNRYNVVESQTGVALTLNFVVVNTNNNCNVVENVRVDIWSCNPDGYFRVCQPGRRC
jgi:protocatechuate 3,4-dioxygenase beta subunit